jgi:hypothetical protein
MCAPGTCTCNDTAHAATIAAATPHAHSHTFEQEYFHEHESKGVVATVKPYKKLIITLIVVTILAAIVAMDQDPYWHGVMQYFMAYYFLAFGLLQTLSLNKSAKMFQQYDPIAKRIHLYGYMLPLIQIGLGIAYLLWAPVYALSFATIVILGITLTGISSVIDSQEKVRCGCLGESMNVKVGWVTFAENFLMTMMAAAMIVFAHIGIHHL